VAAAVGGFGLILLDWYKLPISPAVASKIHRYLLGASGVIVVCGLAKVLNAFVISRMRNAVARFNLTRILRLAVLLAIIFIVVPVLFVNWYAAIVSLGLISLITGFALQTPISSFIGWVYILIRAPYRVGDRIQIGDARGDVIDVGYLDTTLWEIGGRHLSTDHPSGRLIKFPNTNVFNTPVFNYSWPLFPYIWNEIKLNLAYESDLQFVATVMQKIAEEEIGQEMMEKVKVYRDLLARTPVNDLDVQEKPSVSFRVSENTWLEAIVRYLVHPKEAGRVKSRLTVKLLAALNQERDKVMFPKSNAR
jgi:small-conductance mechanosensitive channel